jgi:hypothetical protein
MDLQFVGDPLVLVILSGRSTESCWLRLPDIGAELGGPLVEADLREARIVQEGVDVEHVLHVPDELGVLLRRDAPLLLEEAVPVLIVRWGRRRSASERETT